jgi:outer membrane protein OmpA-like peptidoglycan-associated protein
VLLCSSPAASVSAQEDSGFAGQTFHPAPDRASDYVTAHSGRLLPAHGYSAGLAFHYARDPLQVANTNVLRPSYAGPYSGTVIEDRFVLHALGAYGLASFLQVGLDLPVVLTQSGGERTGLEDPGAVSESAGLGDVRLLGKLRIYDNHAPASENRFSFALVADVGLPTGQSERYQGGTTRLAPVLVAEWRSSFGARIAGNLGYAWHADEPRFADVRVEGGPLWSVGLELPVWQERIGFVAEAFGDLATELQLGLRGRHEGFLGSVTAGPGLSDDTLTPDYRIALAFGYRGGTPDSQDADGDGIRDDADRCPGEPEDLDRFEDQDGCPDADNDGDRLLDADDRCPTTPEDLDRFEDQDGCPDADNDGDGIVDASDRCPLSVEDADGFEDGDGCAEADNDGDGVVDANDACPRDPEDPDGENDQDGCPDVTAAVRVDVIVFFAHNADAVSAESRVTLDRVAHTLIAMPDELHVWINGHADDTGKHEYNEQLGQRRANAVRQYLLERGVPAERMTAQSYGDTKNVFVAQGEQDRVANRHVDFRVGPRSVSTTTPAPGATPAPPAQQEAP